MKNRQEEIVNKIQSLDWEYWLERPFGGFMISLFKGGNTKQSFAKIGLPDIEIESFVCQNKAWYQSDMIWRKMEKKWERYFEHGSIFDITKSLDKFYREKKKRIKYLAADKTISNRKKLAELAEIMSMATSYLWSTHGLEVYYSNKLSVLVPRYYEGEQDIFIGDASYPSKKNAHALMEEAILDKIDPQKIVEKYGWLKSRDGFSAPFNVADIKKIKAKKQAEPKKISIPKPLKQIFKETRELVYFRTYRTDVFYELLFIARPILQAVAVEYGYSFQDLADYPIQGLAMGKPQKVEMPFTAVAYKNDFIFLNKELFKGLAIDKEIDIRGMAAQRGIAQGRVVIVRTVADVDKVKSGDVMVARMTFPAYIMGMKKAVAFVTDEGGLTCHAAIVAREMRKPCIIGTKNATKVLKDGDLVEVDADRGVVRIIK